MNIVQTKTAVAPFINASFGVTGTLNPIDWEVLPGGAGGSIDSAGWYTAPSAAPSDPKRVYDTIQATDTVTLETKTSRILVGTPLLLFCEILSRQMPIALDRIWIWDQRIPEPTDDELYVAVGNPRSKPFGNVNRAVSAAEEDPLDSEQFIVTVDTLDVTLISRGPSARTRKLDVFLALNSDYARFQMASNSFGIGILTPHFINQNIQDGASIPYRYNITVNIQYAYQRSTSVDYYDNNFMPQIITDYIEDTETDPLIF